MVIHIDIAAYVHDTRSQMEETQTMNSYYHPREHDHEHKDEAHCPHNHGLPVMPIADIPGDVQGQHSGDDTAHGMGDVHDVDGSPRTGKDQDVYRVLVAVERGELSVQDAARQLEELEAESPGQESGELI
jgi:hypothetical protein